MREGGLIAKEGGDDELRGFCSWWLYYRFDGV